MSMPTRSNGCRRNLKNRDSVIISLHPHNDRGTGVAATELALMAGADRVEGTLFGNGERTGNVCLVTLAGQPDHVRRRSQARCLRHQRRWCASPSIATSCRSIRAIPMRASWSSRPFPARIRTPSTRASRRWRRRGSRVWEVPYLPIDPKDLGRTYEAVIRINSQSGKGGIAYILEKEHGLELPRLPADRVLEGRAGDRRRRRCRAAGRAAVARLHARNISTMAAIAYVSHREPSRGRRPQTSSP